MAIGAAGSQPGETAAPEEGSLNARQARRYARVRKLVRRAVGRFSRFGDLDTPHGALPGLRKYARITFLLLE